MYVFLSSVQVLFVVVNIATTGFVLFCLSVMKCITPVNTCD